MSCGAFLGASFLDYFVALRCREFRLAGKDLASAIDETLPRKRARTLKREASGDGSLMLSASSRVTRSQDVVDGTLSPFLGRQNLENFKTALSLGDPLVPLGVPGQSRGPEALDLIWASCCSGSEGVKYVVEAANLAMAEQGFPVEFHHKFSCEISTPKQKWIKAVLHSGPAFWLLSRVSAAAICRMLCRRYCGFGRDICDVHRAWKQMFSAECWLPLPWHQLQRPFES